MADLLSDDPSRCPSYLLSLVEWLPADGALSACMQAAPKASKVGAPSGAHAYYGRGPLWYLLADAWDLQAAIGMAGSKKKPPSYPRPGVKKQGSGTPLMAFMPKRRPASTGTPATPPPPARAARVAGRRKGR